MRAHSTRFLFVRGFPFLVAHAFVRVIEFYLLKDVATLGTLLLSGSYLVTCCHKQIWMVLESECLRVLNVFSILYPLGLRK